MTLLVKYYLDKDKVNIISFKKSSNSLNQGLEILSNKKYSFTIIFNKKWDGIKTPLYKKVESAIAIKKRKDKINQILNSLKD